MHGIRIFHTTLSVLLHEAVKLKRYNCCQFQWHLAIQASKFILPDIRVHNNPDLENNAAVIKRIHDVSELKQ